MKIVESDTSSIYSVYKLIVITVGILINDNANWRKILPSKSQDRLLPSSLRYLDLLALHLHTVVWHGSYRLIVRFK